MPTFLSMDNPLLTRVEDAWVVTAPAVAFALMARNITGTHIRKLQDVVHKVFKEIDPIVDIHPNERSMVGLRTPGLSHSPWLREGLAGSLLRLVVLGQALDETGVIPGGAGRQQFVDNIIRGLPGLRDDYRLLVSLRNQLPVLAEAAPNPFLDALEELLQGPPESLLPIFEEGNGPFGRHPLHSNILWALETLAWEPAYLARVGLILARLAKIDPGGQFSNRPINSLREIFLAWSPGTSAGVEQRFQALDLILDHEPGIGWKLLTLLMPSPYGVSHPTSQPEWRDFGRSIKGPVTGAMIRETYYGLMDRLLLHAGENPERYKSLINLYAEMSPTHRQSLEAKLKQLAQSGLTDESRNDLWGSLRKFVNKHLGFKDASWALPRDDIHRLVAIVELFQPSNTVEQVAWLFNEYLPDIPFPNDDTEAKLKELRSLRVKALEGLWQDGNSEALVSLANRVEYPGFVAESLLEIIHNPEQVFRVFVRASHGSTKERRFAQFVSAYAYTRFGNKWAAMFNAYALEQGWQPDVIANAILRYPDSMETYGLVKSFGTDVERLYWELRPHWIGCKDEPVFRFAIKKFLWAERALDVITLGPEQLAMLESSVILQVLDLALKKLNAGETPGGHFSHHINALFECIRNRSDIDRGQIAQWEYAFLPLLTGYPRPKELVLYSLLADRPEWFVDIICDLYAPSSHDNVEELSERQEIRARFAFKILYSWRQPPGVDGGKVDGQQLRDWVLKARQLAVERDCAIVADQHIGRVLYYFPADPTDNVWPHRTLRRLLEDLKSEEIEIGIRLEQYNARGTVAKGLFEGGKQERELAEMWLSRAEALGAGWPRTRSLLEQIADGWLADAVKEDQRAEKDRLRFK